MVLIKKRDVTELSAKIRKAIDGQAVDFRENREGAWAILKNDIHTLVSQKSEQVDAFQHERDFMAESLANISHQLKTPLTSMMIMADLLEQAPPDKQEECIANLKIGIQPTQNQSYSHPVGLACHCPFHRFNHGYL